MIPQGERNALRCAVRDAPKVPGCAGCVKGAGDSRRAAAPDELDYFCEVFGNVARKGLPKSA
jgi:hypothetical protein